MDQYARDEFSIENFKLGLSVELRKHVQFTHPCSMDEAVAAAIECEALQDEAIKPCKPVNVIHRST